MTLKARRSSHRNRVGWTRVKTGQSRGWGLPLKWPSINRKLLKPFLSKKVFALVTITIVVLGVMYADPNNPLFHSYEKAISCIATGNLPCNDPATLIWQATAPNNDLSEFNTVGFNAAFNTNAGCGAGAGWTGSCMILTGSNLLSTVAVTKNSVGDLGITNGKTLGFHITFGSTNVYLQNPVEWGYYLTTNSTVPSATAYNPRTDANVLFNVRMYCAANCLTTPTFTGIVYMLRNIGKGETITSEGSDSCPPGSNPVFLCQTSNLPVPPNSGNGFVADSSVYLNYTAKTNQSACGITNATGTFGAGCSYLEDGNQPIPNAQDWNFIDTFPWAKLQAQQLYLGFYVRATGGANQPITFFFNTNNGSVVNGVPHGTGCGGGGCFANMVIFYWVPTPSGAIVGPQIDTGGFFGPLINALVNVGVWILNGVEQYLGFLAVAIKIGLNAIGSFFGWGNIGDTFVNTVTGIVTTIVSAATAVTNFLANLVSRGLDLLNIATTFSSVFFTGIQKFLSEMSTISGGIVTIFSKLFLYGGAFYFLYDLILYFQLTGDAGFEGVGTWIGFNKWAAFSVFGLLTRILNVLISAFDWILSHIPTIGAAMPPNGFPGIPQLEAGQFPGLRVPTGHVTKLREGDPAAFFLWAVGGFLILPFYLGSAISPLAGLTAAVGCNPTTCFNNMLTTVGYPFAGLFIIIFVGVTITEILHGVTDTGGQRIVIQNKFPAGFGRFKKEARGEFSFGTGKFAQFKKGRVKSRNKAVERQETFTREQIYESKHGGKVFE